MSTSTQITWLITGCSSGIGFELAKTVLKAGHKVIASSRNPQRTPDLVEEIKSLGGSWVTLDVQASESDLQKIVDQVIAQHGQIDVLVNNAGYSVLGAMEDISLDEAQNQFDVNFFGPFKLIHAVIPSMRQRKSGTIVNISSIAGQTALPTCSIYAASKHALEAMTESLSAEVQPFNIRTVIVEPGAFRTNFFAQTASPRVPVSAPYRGTALSKQMDKFDSMHGGQQGDASKASQRILEFVTRTGMAAGLKEEHLRLPLGKDCEARIRVKLDILQKNLDYLSLIARSTDHES